MEEFVGKAEEKPETSLFLSHATEDKSFARPLAAALSARGFKVWYDEDQMRVGQSLFRRINDGIQDCNYGVTVLSQQYLARKWTTDEFKGLWALETSQRTIILPVWLDVTRSDVEKFAPMLVDRFAIKASEGPERVAQLIAASTSAANVAVTRKPEDALKSRLSSVSDEVRSARYHREQLSSSQGASRVRECFDTMIQAASQYASTLGTPELEIVSKIQPQSAFGPFLSISASGGLSLQAKLSEWSFNSASIAKLEICLRRAKFDRYRDEKSVKLREVSLEPYLTPDTVFWRKSGVQFSASEFPAYILGFLVDQLEKDNVRKSG